MKNKSFSNPTLEIIRPIEFKKDLQLDPDEGGIFLHIPKTGGSTVLCLLRSLVEDEIRFAVPRVDGQSPSYIPSGGWIGGLESAINAIENNPQFCEDKKIFSGHFPYGLHSVINRKAKYFSVVRSPKEWFLSQINFDLQRGYFERHQALNYGAGMVDNPQTRIFAGIKHMSGECGKDTLAIAKKTFKIIFYLLVLMKI